MAVKIRRSYKGAASSAVLDSAGVSSSTQTSIALTTSPSNWPTGKFFVVVAPGTAQEEKMCVTISGSTLTVVSPTTSSTSANADGRGVDDTTARSLIAGGSTVYPVYTAIDANEANELTSTYANQGGMVYQGASTFTQLGIGTAGQVLKVNSGATAPEWGQVAEAGIADDAVTASKIAANAVGSSEIASAAVGLDELATAVVNKLVPVGTIAMYGGASAPTGWLLCDGTAINAGYTALIAIVGANTPDFKGRFAIGDNSTLTLLGTGGSATIGTNNLPSHSHANTASAGGMTANATLTHSVSDPGHAHTLDVSTTSGGVAGVLNYFDGGTVESGYVNSASTGISVGNHDVSHSHTITMTNASTGGGEAYYQPYLVVNYIIKHD